MSAKNKEIAMQKIINMPKERVSKVLIFMAGMEAESMLEEKNIGTIKDNDGPKKHKKTFENDF